MTGFPVCIQGVHLIRYDMPHHDRSLGQDRVPDLHDLLSFCDSSPGEEGSVHDATEPLFPYLVKETEARPFESGSHRLISDKVWEGIPKGTRLHHVGVRMLQFDALADHLQMKFFARLKIVCLLAFGFLCLFELFAHGLKELPLVLAAAFALLGIAIFVVKKLRSKTLQLGYLSSRAIAEILRIQFFMEASGAGMAMYERIPRRHKPIFGRVLVALREVWRESKNLPKHNLDRKIVDEGWFDGQMKYFKKAADREENAARSLATWSSMLFIASILIIATYGVLKGGAILSHQELELWVEPVFLVVGPTLLAAAAICEFYLERRGFKANAERYRHSVHIYDVPSERDWEENVHDVGAEALHEIIDWYVASVEREICVPKG